MVDYMNNHEHINYIELPAKDLIATKNFFSEVFNWEFTDYGPEYTSFVDGSIAGGFFHADLASSTAHGGALIVFYSKALEETQTKICNASGEIIKPIFSFPGGRRFHFTEPSGNEFAVWSDN